MGTPVAQAVAWGLGGRLLAFRSLADRFARRVEGGDGLLRPVPGLDVARAVTAGPVPRSA